ncbi:MAG: DUF2147 domain-containing protein, partial [Actinomycetota bacterium]|nr:DUF2147 domain-containing protein [Actinomycetota bacterium]
MSATARAAGTPAEDRPGRRTPPPLVKGPVPLTARTLAASLRTGPPATGERAAAAVRTDRSASPAP